QNVPIYLAALVLGLLIPFSIIYLKTSLNDKVTDKREVEHITKVPILGEIVHGENLGPLQITEGNYSVIAETFRLVRANLQFASLGNENKVILVTSSDSGEGKTFVSINLGASLALSGKKVLLMGFDLRKPRLMKALGLSNLMGITDYLISNELSVESLIVPLEGVEDLYLLGAGTLPPNPAELIMSVKVKQLMDELRKQFDFIIVDSPPVGRVADVFSLVPYIDSTLYIIRYNYTTKTQLAILKDIQQNKRLKHL